MPNDVTDMKCEFELEPYKPGMTGWISAYIRDNDGTDPVTVIDCDSGGTIVIEWDIDGSLRDHMCGKWCVTAYLESIGPGPELALPGGCECIDWEPCHDGSWKKEIAIPQGIECTDCGSLYQVGVTLTSKDGCGNPGHVAAFCKGATVMFYKGTDH